MKTSDSIAKISAALVPAQASMGNAAKDAKNPFFKSSYADLNSIREAVMPALHANGISLLQPTVVQDGKAYIETVLLHVSGEFISSMTEIIIGKQNDAQSAGSGMSYARRYGLQALLCVGAEDDDGESTMNRGNKSKSMPGLNPLPPKDPLAVSSGPLAQPPSRFDAHRSNKLPTDLSTMSQAEVRALAEKVRLQTKDPKHVITAEERAFMNLARTHLLATTPG